MKISHGSMKISHGDPAGGEEAPLGWGVDN